MPRKPREFVEGGLYHVYNRFARGEDVFDAPEEAGEFAELLKKVKQRDGLTIYAWALLSNHYHVAMRTSAVPLSRTMHYVQGTFSRRFNRRWRRTGPLWQSRYQARVIDDQRYFDQVMVYVHLNPIRAGLTDDPVDYEFSGHRELMRRVKNPLVDVDKAFLGFGDSLRAARRQYSARIRAGIDDNDFVVSQGHLELLPERDRDLDASEPIFIDELGRSTGLERPSLDVGRYLELVCSILNIDLDRLSSSRRDRETAALRKLVVAVGIERWGQRAGKLANVLNKHSVAASRWVSDAARERQSNPLYEKKLLRLDEELSKRALAAQSTQTTRKGKPKDEVLSELC